VALRLAFLLHAEDRGLLPAGVSVRGLRTRSALFAEFKRVFADSVLALRSPRVADRTIRTLVAALSVLDGGRRL